MDDIRKLPWPTQIAFGLVALLLLFVVYDQHHWWDAREEYLFGYLVPFFVAFIIYDRWPKIRMILLGSQAGEDSNRFAREFRPTYTADLARPAAAWILPCGQVLAYGAFAFGLMAILIAAIYRVAEGNNLISSQLLAYSVAALLPATVFLFSTPASDGSQPPTWTRLRLVSFFVFPALIWMLSAPLFSVAEIAISTFLLNKVSVVVYHVFDFLGFAITREGSVLQLPKGPVMVEDACSGIRSLMACLFSGSFLGAALLDRFWKKVAMVAMAMVFAFVMNIGRSLFLTAWAYAYGSEAIGQQAVIFGHELGTVHDVTGYAVLVLTVAGLLCLVPLFNLKTEYAAPAEAPGEPSPEAAAKS